MQGKLSYLALFHVTNLQAGRPKGLPGNPVWKIKFHAPDTAIQK